MNKDKANHPISLLEATLPLITMAFCLIAGGLIFPIGAEVLMVVMLISATVAGLIAIRRGHSWDDIQHFTGHKFAAVLPVILILLSIGMLIGSWMFSGTIPMLVYYGIKLIDPQYMIFTAFLTTACMSLTGSSFAAAGTIGVALMGVAMAVDAPIAITAGAVISGAYFGDKLSPLSDSTNICAIGANAELYAHIRNMVYTALPSFVLAFIVYFIIGLNTNLTTELADVNNHPLLGEIEKSYNVTWIVFLPILVVLWGTINKKPAALTMAISSVFALIIGVLAHGFNPYFALQSAVSGFNVSMIEPYASSAAVPNDMLASLLNRGGINSLSNNLIVIIAAFLLAAGMDVAGGLDKILKTMLKFANSAFGLIAATMAAGMTMIATTSHGGVTSLLVGNLFQGAYKEMKLAPENLSRSLEDSVSITEPLMPWTASAIFMATTLGVPTVEYMPWAIFCMTGWIFSLLIAALHPITKFGLKPLKKE